MSNDIYNQGARSDQLLVKLSLIIVLLLPLIQTPEKVRGASVSAEWSGPEISIEIASSDQPLPAPNPPKIVPRSPTVSLTSYSCESFRPLVARYGWNVSVALNVMFAESGCNPLKHNWGDRHKTCLGSFGLLQIGCIHGYSVAYLENPANNIAAAWKIYQGAGWKSWGVCTSGKVRCY